MSKWLKILCLTLFTVTFFAITLVVYISENDLKKFGKRAAVDPIKDFVEETRTSTKFFSKIVSKSQWATMTYNDGIKKVTFKREITGDVLNKFRNGEQVFVLYIPNDYNTEQFEGYSSEITFPFIAFLISCGVLIFVIKRKEVKSI
ncbi:hypothetical protein [Undibacterium flavidum]|uniref:DUF3592 domain-containing protein n=1 Tax=Undibacterium flavidum TaxID=2762297 RepID=A0ABR6YAF8_9BURK|nr:hypothetical protein [Undibacterium flavidum]MBC3873590.1 hypothetical protein [Undibacterium flavidum]